MSRIGKKPVTIAENVKASYQDEIMTIEGPKGTLTRRLHPEMIIEVSSSEIVVKRPSEAKRHLALHGLTRSLINNMMEGVTRGFMKSLEIQGVGYRAELADGDLVLQIGFFDSEALSIP